MKQRLWGLDLVRASAIAMVLLAHSFQLFYPFGFFGVELFFALSGYLIGGILLDSLDRRDVWTGRDLVQFWTRRWFRTLPNYYIYLAGYVLVAGASFTVWWRYAFFLQNLIPLKMEDFFGVSWSLTVEEWFYFLFPGLVFLIHRVGRLSAKQAFVGAAVLLLIGALGARIAVVAGGSAVNWDDALRKPVLLRLDAIMWGVLVADMKRQGWNCRRLLVASLTISSAGLLAFGFQSAGHGGMIAPCVMLTLIPAGAAMALPASESISGSGWFYRAVEFTSKISYSLYLSHALIIGFIVGTALYRDASPMLKVLLKFGQFAAVFLVSYLSYKFIELPFLRLRDIVSRDRDYADASGKRANIVKPTDATNT